MMERASLMERKLQDCEEKLSAIDDLIVRRIKHHQEMKDSAGSGTARKREHYKLHVLSETLGEIRKVTKTRRMDKVTYNVHRVIQRPFECKETK